MPPPAASSKDSESPVAAPAKTIGMLPLKFDHTWFSAFKVFDVLALYNNSG
jgi:hypothetical protein